MIQKLWRHLANWPEGYLWVPIPLLATSGSGLLIYAITGHDANENVDGLADYASLSVKSTLIILFTSIAKQALGSWLTKEEKLAHPVYAFASGVLTLVMFLSFVYVFTH